MPLFLQRRFREPDDKGWIRIRGTNEGRIYKRGLFTCHLSGAALCTSLISRGLWVSHDERLGVDNTPLLAMNNLVVSLHCPGLFAFHYAAHWIRLFLSFFLFFIFLFSPY
jgi:hypothetical protein